MCNGKCNQGRACVCCGGEPREESARDVWDVIADFALVALALSVAISGVFSILIFAGKA